MLWRRRGRMLWSGACLLVVVSAVAGCTAPASDDGAGHEHPSSAVSPRSSGTPTAVATDGCVSPGDATYGRDGVISAGPFAENRGRWRDGTKFWVKTSVDQKPTAATIRATLLDSDAPTVTVVRGKDTIAALDGDSSGLFFPGLLQLPRQGTWKIAITIGAESGCFLVRV